MPTRCSVKNCYNYFIKARSNEISYHRFPKNEELKWKWIAVCENSKISGASRICSVHFRENDYKRDLCRELTGGKSRRLLKENAVPSLLLENKEESGRGLEVKENLREYSENEPKKNNADITEDKTTNIKEMNFNLHKQDKCLPSSSLRHEKVKETNTKLKIKLCCLDRQVDYYKSKVHKSQIAEKKLRDILSRVLTENQLKILLHKEERVRYSFL